MRMNIIIKAQGMGWEATLPAELEEDRIIVNKDDLLKFLGTISYTHDTISGGFLVKAYAFRTPLGEPVGEPTTGYEETYEITL